MTKKQNKNKNEQTNKIIIKQQQQQTNKHLSSGSVLYLVLIFGISTTNAPE